MTPTLQAKRDALLDHRHHSLRRRVEFEPAERFEQERLSHARRVTEALCRMIEAETPYIAPGESIFFWRTVENLPPILTDAEWARLRESGFLHEQGRVCNLSPDYGRVIRRGLGAERAEAERLLAGAQDNEQAEFYCCAIASIDAVLDLCARYQKAAEDCGSPHAGVLSRVPSTRRCRACASCNIPCGARANTTTRSAALTSTCGRIWSATCGTDA